MDTKINSVINSYNNKNTRRGRRNRKDYSFRHKSSKGYTPEYYLQYLLQQDEKSILMDCKTFYGLITINKLPRQTLNREGAILLISTIKYSTHTSDI